MKVLHLPYNIASWASINTKALNEIPEIEARALIFGEKSVLHDHENINYVSQKNKLQTLKSIWVYKKHIQWADVLHWYFDHRILPNDLAMKMVMKHNKPAIIEWLGSDIRNPKIEFENNPYFKDIFHLVYPNQSPDFISNESILLQKKFGSSGFCSLTCKNMEQHLTPEVYKANFSLAQRIELDQFPEIDPKMSSTIKIAHAPSKKDIKGTKFVIEAIDKLKVDGFDIKFDLIHNVPHKEAIARISECDIFIDQLILGTHGMAAIEALSMNKAVVVYLNQPGLNSLPSEHPFINANIDNLYQTLKNTISEPEQLKKIKASGRTYVQMNHDSKKLTSVLVKIYEEVIALTKS